MKEEIVDQLRATSDFLETEYQQWSESAKSKSISDQEACNTKKEQSQKD